VESIKRENMKEEPKILEEGESTFGNGGGAMCGGIISKSMFDSDPWAYMMVYYMDDDRFEEYKTICADKTLPEKERRRFFDKYARSAI